jgi:putative membrane protein
MSEDVGKDPRVLLAEDRTEMAAFRTSLALDRTSLAWIRTTLSMTTFGLGLIGYFRTVRMQNETPASIRMHELAIHFGIALVVIGLIATVLVARSHWSTVRKLRAGETPQPPLWPLSITVSLLLALLGLYGLWRIFS